MKKVRITSKQKRLLESNTMAFGTSDLNGKPNVIAVASVKVVGVNKILITDNLFEKTKKNLLSNNKVSITVWSKDEKYGFQFKGAAEYLTAGKWKNIIDNMEENKGLSHKAAVLVTIKEIYPL